MSHPLNALALLECLKKSQPMLRLDSIQTQSLERQLLALKTEILREQYGLLKATELIPLATGTEPGAEEVSYPLLSDIGRAAVVGNYADDIPVIEVALDEFKTRVYTLAAAWIWTWLDLQRAALSGFPISIEKVRAVRDAIARRIDEIAFIGIPEANVGGLVNHPNVPGVGLTNGDWLNPTTTPDQILADLLEWEDAIISNTLENWYPNQLVLPGAYYRKLLEPRATFSDRSIWEQFVASSQLTATGRGEWSLDRTQYLDDVEGEPRGLMYARDPAVLELELPLEWAELAPQENNLATKVPAVARIAGTIWKRPLAAAYALNLGEPEEEENGG